MNATLPDPAPEPPPPRYEPDAWLGWFDDQPKKPAATKVAEACERYAVKYGQPATFCGVNEQDAATVVEGVDIRPYRNIRPHYYWPGCKPL